MASHSPSCPECRGPVFGPPRGGIVFAHTPGPGTRVRCDSCGLLVTLPAPTLARRAS